MSQTTTQTVITPEYLKELIGSEVARLKETRTVLPNFERMTRNMSINGQIVATEWRRHHAKKTGVSNFTLDIMPIFEETDEFVFTYNGQEGGLSPEVHRVDLATSELQSFEVPTEVTFALGALFASKYSAE